MKDYQWIKCKSDIINYIEKNKLEMYGELPSDLEFSQFFNCSIQPVKRAMNELAQEKKVFRSAGKKTQVGDLTEKKFGFSQSIIKRGYEPINEVKEFKAIKLDISNTIHKQVIDFFEIKNEKITVIKRLRWRKIPGSIPEILFSGAIQTVYLNPAILTYQKLEVFDLKDVSLIHLYNIMGCTDLKRIGTLKAVELDIESQQLFNLEKPHPALELTQRMTALYHKKTIPLEFMVSVYAQDFEFDIPVR